MDRWKFFDITHRDHVVCNPLSVEKVDQLVSLLDLPIGSRVLGVGYESEAAFSRALERMVGMAPGAWRSGNRR